MNNTILLIEDNKDLLENTAEILELANYKVLKAADGKAGMELALKSTPDIILCDVMMPQLDGYGVLRAIRNQPEFTMIPFVFVTSKSETTDFRYGMDLGADDFLAKPFTGDQLLSIVAARINKAEQIKTAGNKSKRTGITDNKCKLPELLMQLLAGKIKVKKLRKKESLFIEGEDSNFLYQISSGRVKTYKINEGGKEYITNIYKPDDFFGFHALIEDRSHVESGEALEDSEIKLISKQDFIEVLNENPLIATKLVQFLSCTIAEMNETRVNLAYNSARKRVADAITYISLKYPNDSNLPTIFPMNRNDISALSGISPESVSRNLTDFRCEGLIDIHDGKIEILDFKKLSYVKN